MKKIFALLSLVLVLASCSRDMETYVSMESGEGAMRMSVALAAEPSEDQAISIKIYREVSADVRELVRRYTSLADVPEYLTLLADNYIAVVEVGEKHVVSFDEKCYRGEKKFTVTSGRVESVVVDCKLLSTIAAVEYDATVSEELEAGYHTTIAIADTYDQAGVNTGDIHSLKYTESKEGYYMMPEANTKLVWHFEGKHPEEGKIVREGVISNVKASAKYTVKFSYSKDGDGFLVISATVDESVEEFDDNISFSPDPTIMGAGFSLDEVQSAVGAARSYNISALAAINDITIIADGVEFDVLNGNVEGITVVKTDDMNYVVTINEPFFVNVPGGENAIKFHVEDVDGGKKDVSVVYNAQGVLPLTAADYDLWYGNATIKAQVLNSSATNVKIAYRVSGGAWTEVAATSAGDGIYTAAATGFTAEKAYEYKLIINSVDTGKALIHNTAAGSQLPNSGLEEWHQGSNNAYYPYMPGAAAFWLTGNDGSQKAGINITYPKSDARPGSTGTTSAYLESTKASVAGIGKFAAGNLFTGTFSMKGLNGMVGFGRDFSFNAKPKSFSVWLKNKAGTIDENSGNPASGLDVNQVMVILTTWDEAHVVDTSNTDTFISHDMLATMDGVVAYGVYRTQTTNESWYEQTIDLTYVSDAKPTKVVISFASSAYGDYFCGSTSSYMYVDDMQFNY
ncbi:MAG: PCMD domain-containing protein [Alistipes sp.]|nr:PCMD domain-containing protein [Alistipes sp.]